MPSERKTSSKVGLKLRVPVMNEKAERLLIAELHHQVARLLGDPAAVRVGRTGDVFDPPRRQREKKQHVDPLQERGLDGEEIAGEHARLRGVKTLIQPGNHSFSRQNRSFETPHALFKLEHVNGNWLADQLARLQVRYPEVQLTFAEPATRRRLDLPLPHRGTRRR
jgi:hypothetical protein